MKNRRQMTIAIVLLAVLSPFVLTALYVDDWSRDLTTNVAWTDPDGDDETLRPVATNLPPADVLEALASFANASPAWSAAESAPPAPPTPALPEDSPLSRIVPGEPFAVLHLVRTTGFMRYQDDVWVVIEASNDETIVHAHSQSRVGKGDLGQNPRNLRELLGALREFGSEKSEE